MDQACPSLGAISFSICFSLIRGGDPRGPPFAGSDLVLNLFLTHSRGRPPRTPLAGSDVVLDLCFSLIRGGDPRGPPFTGSDLLPAKGLILN